MNLEDFLNIAIPLGAFLFLAVILFSRFKDPIMDFFKWMGSLFGSSIEKLSDNATSLKGGPTEIIYK